MIIDRLVKDVVHHTGASIGHGAFNLAVAVPCYGNPPKYLREEEFPFCTCTLRGTDLSDKGHIVGVYQYILTVRRTQPQDYLKESK
jgi:hypothetical protein